MEGALTDFTITPKVDEVHEFLEIAADFTNPLELVREAISNSLDADAAEISIEFSTIRQLGAHVLLISIRDNGHGMDDAELQSFFDLGNSPKRLNKQHNPNTIGEKGHGTKVYFRCSSIAVTTSKAGTLLEAKMNNPYAQLSDGRLPRVECKRTENAARSDGTEIKLRDSTTINLKNLRTNESRTTLSGLRSSVR
jgi:histidine kinase/DNA gyrase B/HSP90-like ATPase